MVTPSQKHAEGSTGKRGKKVKSKDAISRPRTSSSNRYLQFFAYSLLIGLASLACYRWFPSIRETRIGSDTGAASTLKDASLFHVIDIPGKGKGVVAGRDIKQGETILQEWPLFTMPLHVRSSPTALIWQKIKSLSLENQQAFFNLSYVNFPENLVPEENLDEIALAIFQTNGVSAGTDEVGIFPTMARLNHGCSSAFNVVYHWRNEKEGLFVHALKDIRKGQELLTTYTDTKRPREERRAYLSSHYGFKCTCDVCSLPDDLSKASDQRLSQISSLYGRFATWGGHEISGIEAMDHIRTIWKIEDVEGYWSERGQLAADAAWIAAAHSDASATRAWALKAVEWFGYELGTDSAQVQRLTAVVNRPESHDAWGTREELEIDVGYSYGVENLSGSTPSTERPRKSNLWILPTIALTFNGTNPSTLVFLTAVQYASQFGHQHDDEME